jgi:branched-chain amino acid transport system permease protein
VGSGLGRAPAQPNLLGFDLYARRTVLGTELSAIGVFYLFALLLLVVMAILARNVARTRQGRAFSAVRDRDIAAEVMGVPLLRTKRLAFTLSSFYAGIGGALLTIVLGFTTPERWNLLLSIDFLAVVLIGGSGDDHRPDHRRRVRRAHAALHRDVRRLAAVHLDDGRWAAASSTSSSCSACCSAR